MLCITKGEHYGIFLLKLYYLSNATQSVLTFHCLCHNTSELSTWPWMDIPASHTPEIALTKFKPLRMVIVSRVTWFIAILTSYHLNSVKNKLLITVFKPVIYLARFIITFHLFYYLLNASVNTIKSITNISEYIKIEAFHYAWKILAHWLNLWAYGLLKYFKIFIFQSSLQIFQQLLNVDVLQM